MGYRLEGGRSKTRKQVGGGTAVGFQHGRQQFPPSSRLDARSSVGREIEREVKIARR